MAIPEAFRNQLISASFSLLDGEEKLIRDAVRGESSAFGFLYDHYVPRIYRFVYLKIGQREEAEDLTHQVFLHAWEHIRDYRHRGFPFSSWLYRIARNIVIDSYRARRPTTSIENIDSEVMAAPFTVELAADHSIEFHGVKAAIQKLRPEYQDVIVMRFIEELSIGEVAAALEKSIGAVKLMQHRAMKELKRLLQ